MFVRCSDVSYDSVLQYLTGLYTITSFPHACVLQLTAEVFEELNNSPPELKAIHAGMNVSGSPHRLLPSERCYAILAISQLRIAWPCLQVLNVASLASGALEWTWSGASALMENA